MAGAATNPRGTRAKGRPRRKARWAGHLAAVANEGAAYRGAVGPAANGRRRECGGSLFELAAAADGGWRRAAPAVRGHRGWGCVGPLCRAPVGPAGPLRPPAVLLGQGGAPGPPAPAGSSGERLGVLRPAPAASLLRAREPSGVVPREAIGKRGRCSLSFPCLDKLVLVCGCFVSFRLSTNCWEVISECDAVGASALPEACSDGVLTFALYVRENSSCLCVLCVLVCILALSVRKFSDKYYVINYYIVVKTKKIFKYTQDGTS